MNEIYKAIEHFEHLQKRYATQHNGKYCELIETALAALRKKAERERGCEWCKVGRDNARTVWIDGSFDAFTGDSYGEGASHKGIIDRKVAYCPICGREVEVEP